MLLYGYSKIIVGNIYKSNPNGGPRFTHVPLVEIIRAQKYIRYLPSHPVLERSHYHEQLKQILCLRFELELFDIGFDLM